MATESGFNPTAFLVHALAIAAGIYLGFLAMDAIAPDFPAESEAPGVSSSVAPEAVRGDDPDSLFQPDNLRSALDALQDQIGAGQGVLRVRITPGSLEAQTASGDGVFQPDEVPDTAPSSIAKQASASRSQVSLADFAYFDLVATSKGPEWYGQLDTSLTEVSPPWTYRSPLSGLSVTEGGAPPRPVDADAEQTIAPPPVPPA
ncbi:MAG TPA: hypothetical protein VHF58_02985 [Solirubrobacterales bacterium]|nr:hypothetical protein [Solirubrobacterales bacterium]